MLPPGLSAQTSAQGASGLNSAAPGLDAEDDDPAWELPRISRYLDDDEFIVFLAALKLRDGKYRLSANKIVAAAGAIAPMC